MRADGRGRRSPLALDLGGTPCRSRLPMHCRGRCRDGDQMGERVTQVAGPVKGEQVRRGAIVAGVGAGFGELDDEQRARRDAPEE